MKERTVQKRMLYLMRHARPAEQFAKRFMGRLDPGLSPTGVSQAEEVAKLTATLCPQRCISSPLKRAYETARIVASTCGLTVELSDVLKEIDYGDLEGRTHQEARKENPGLGDMIYLQGANLRFPGGEDIASIERRAGAVVDLIRAAPEERLLLVTHHGILRALMFQLLNVGDFRPRLFMSHASLSIFERNEDGNMVLTGFNLGGGYLKERSFVKGGMT
jgi:broad specificity phosphatase PhoE